VRDRYPYEKTVAALRAHPERFFRSQLCSGVTAVFDVGGYAWSVAMARATQGSRAPHVAAAGPLLSTLDHWLNLPAERQFMHLKDAESARTGVAYLKAIGSDAVKVWYIVRPDMPVESAAPFVNAAGEEPEGRASPDRPRHGLAEAKAALKAGGRLLVHGVSDLPVDDEFLARQGQGHHLLPTLTMLAGYVAMNRAARAGTPPPVDNVNGGVDPATLAHVAESAKVGAAGRADRLSQLEKRQADAESTGAANLKRVVEAGIPVAMGTDAGNPLTLHGPSVFAEMEAMQAAGMTAMQVLVASTRGGARAMVATRCSGRSKKARRRTSSSWPATRPRTSRICASSATSSGPGSSVAPRSSPPWSRRESGRGMSLRRELGRFDATMVVVGGIIGAGIVINPYLVAQRLPSGPLVLAAWAAGGLIAAAGAFAFAELATLFPKAGGEYVYLREGWHPLVGFLFGWASLLLIQGGGLAAVSITFAQYTLRLAGFGPSGGPLAIVSLVVGPRSTRRSQARQPAAERPGRRSSPPSRC
jgi:hypothetical protein